MNADPYVYEGTGVLVNKYGLRDEAMLDRVERTLSELRIWQMLQDEPPAAFDLDLLRHVHRELFGEIYPFAGEFRTVDVRKAEAVLSGRSVAYATPRGIASVANAAIAGMHAAVAGQGRARWNDLASSVSSLWRSHPFREGNTRAVLVFLHQFARANGFPLDAETMSRSPQGTRDALAFAATGVTEPLANLLAEAFRSDRRRRHPVLGYITDEAADLLARFKDVPVDIAAPGDFVRGQVACSSYGTLLVQTTRGFVAVQEELLELEKRPEPGDRMAAELGRDRTPPLHADFSGEVRAFQPAM